MALGIRQHDPTQDGTLEVEKVQPNCVEEYFVPPDSSLVTAGLDPKEADTRRARLQIINGQHKFWTIQPIWTFGDRPDFMQLKYGQIERIILDDTDIIFPEFDTTVLTTPEGVRSIRCLIRNTSFKDALLRSRTLHGVTILNPMLSIAAS